MSNKRPRTATAPQVPAMAQIQAGIACIIVLTVTLVLTYALTQADETALRWWAGILTIAILPIALGSYWMGHTEARGRIAGLGQGIDAVTKAAVSTTDAAGRTANIRVQAARQAAAPSPQPPTIQQMFLPPAVQNCAGQGVILPPLHADGDVKA